MSQSDNTANDVKETIEDLQGKAEQATKFLVVDMEKAKNELADNWGWITASGFLTMVLGAAALLVPTYATGVAYDGTVVTLGAAGAVGLANIFFADKGHKLKSALSGALYLGVAYYMGTHPQQGLDVLTISIATAIAAEGLYELALAIRNKDIDGRPWHFASGILSVGASVWLTLNIPVSSLFAPGAALGTRLTTNGARKIAVGAAGKELADQRKQGN